MIRIISILILHGMGYIHCSFVNLMVQHTKGGLPLNSEYIFALILEVAKRLIKPTLKSSYVCPHKGEYITQN